MKRGRAGHALKNEATMQVVAGLICREGLILAGQRKEGGLFPLKWEFPGGKVEKGEEFQAALKRELREELGIMVISACAVFRHVHSYAGKVRVDLVFYRVDEYEGSIRNIGFEKLAWVAVGELEKLDFLEGDRPLIEKIVRHEIAYCR